MSYHRRMAIGRRDRMSALLWAVFAFSCGPDRPITELPDPSRGESGPFRDTVVDFGRIPIGDRVRLPIYLRNASGAAWTMRSIPFEDSTFAFTSTATQLIGEFEEGLATTVEATATRSAFFSATASVAAESSGRAPETVLLTLAATGVEPTLCAPCDAPAEPICETFTMQLTAKTGTCAEARCTYDRATYPCGGEGCCEGDCQPVFELDSFAPEGMRGQIVTLGLRALSCEGVPFSGATIGAGVDGGGTISPATVRTDHNGRAEFQATLRNRLGIDAFKFELLGWFEPRSTTARITVRE